MASKKELTLKEKVVAEFKSWKLDKETMEKIIKTINYIPVPVLALGTIWGFDISVYVTAGCAVLTSICEFIKLFIKD